MRLGRHFSAQRGEKSTLAGVGNDVEEGEESTLKGGGFCVRGEENAVVLSKRGRKIRKGDCALTILPPLRYCGR